MASELGVGACHTSHTAHPLRMPVLGVAPVLLPSAGQPWLRQVNTPSTGASGTELRAALTECYGEFPQSTRPPGVATATPRVHGPAAEGPSPSLRKPALPLPDFHFMQGLVFFLPTVWLIPSYQSLQGHRLQSQTG
jgi:hypothetical protein